MSQSNRETLAARALAYKAERGAEITNAYLDKIAEACLTAPCGTDEERSLADALATATSRLNVNQAALLRLANTRLSR